MIEQVLKDSKIEIDNQICKHPVGEDVVLFGQQIVRLIVDALRKDK